MLTKRVLEILKLPITAVIGKLPMPYNSYTCFLPFKSGMEYSYLLVTELSEFARRRISLSVPFYPEEEEIVRRLEIKKPVFAPSSLCVDRMTKIPDNYTKFISSEMLDSYPFGTILVPENSILSPLAEDKHIIIRKADFSCNSDRYAEVFGQPRNQTD